MYARACASYRADHRWTHNETVAQKVDVDGRPGSAALKFQSPGQKPVLCSPPEPTATRRTDRERGGGSGDQPIEIAAAHTMTNDQEI